MRNLFLLIFLLTSGVANAAQFPFSFWAPQGCITTFTGGTVISTVGDYKIIEVTANDTITNTGSCTATVQITLVGGGAAGTVAGGGAGAFIYDSARLFAPGAKNVVIGAGGVAGVTPNGSDSTFDSLTAGGGGHGGNPGVNGRDDAGSGGGQATTGFSAGSAGANVGTSGTVSKYGSAGGGTTDPTNSGGGGGADQVGATANGAGGGNGGNGHVDPITGNTFAGGGGGSGTSGSGSGGAGGGGNGNINTGTAGTACGAGGGGGRLVADGDGYRGCFYMKYKFQ